MSLTAGERGVVNAVDKRLFVGGEWITPSSGASFAVEDPSTSAMIAEVSNAGPAEALDALSVAAGTQPSWAASLPRERSEILHRAFELMRSRADELALLVTLEMGKPLAESRGEVLYAAEYLRWFSEEAVRIGGHFGRATATDAHVLVFQQPVGPCLLITPWNFPLAMAARKVGPAIAAGCTMIVKPAEQTPLAMMAFAAILNEAGLPRGVLSVLPTSDPVALTRPLWGDSRLRKLSFTGSTPVGRELLRASADQVLRTSMELGGNAPFLVFDDADIDAAVEGAMLAKMRNMGQACTAANRFHVHASVAREFSSKLADAMSRLQVGRGTEPGVDVGPIIDGEQRQRIEELISDATDRGGRVATGGGRVERSGYFLAPTVLLDVAAESRALTEEVFGPVAPITVFDTDDDAIAAANNTDSGLAAYVYTASWSRGMRVIDEVAAGMIGLNRGLLSDPAAPFGGVKHSGLGREGGPDGIREYLDVKYVSAAR